jgi:hypothetical protein
MASLSKECARAVCRTARDTAGESSDDAQFATGVQPGANRRALGVVTTRTATARDGRAGLIR